MSGSILIHLKVFFFLISHHVFSYTPNKAVGLKLNQIYHVRFLSSDNLNGNVLNVLFNRRFFC